MVCSQGVMSEFHKGSIYPEVGRMKEPRDNGDAQSRHSEGPLPLLCLKGQSGAGLPNTLCCGVGTGQELWATRQLEEEVPWPLLLVSVLLEAQGHGSGVRPSWVHSSGGGERVYWGQEGGRRSFQHIQFSFF